MVQTRFRNSAISHLHINQVEVMEASATTIPGQSAHTWGALYEAGHLVEDKYASLRKPGDGIKLPQGSRNDNSCAS